MPRLIWTPAALGDIQRLYRFLNSKNPLAARRAARAIKAGVRGLAQIPEAGRPIGPAEADLRERVVAFGRDGYVALYRFDGGIVYLLAVRHGREAGY